jgi:CRISPR/Cas system-associated exonuclease Cas4 (RecB family)
LIYLLIVGTNWKLCEYQMPGNRNYLAILPGKTTGMQRFLETCASYIYKNYSVNFSSICIVFPNRRSGVFFTAYLRKLIQKPIIAPEITTINEIMQSLSPLVVTDRLMLITKLYEVFRNVTGTNESFDDFYFWGEVLLADFDDIDKYMVNARDLFQNIADIKEIERHFDYLTEEQKAMLERFWGSLKNFEHCNQERDFVSLWEKLFSVYSQFQKQLSEKQIGYVGMAMRDGIEKLDTNRNVLSYDKYLFVGLNAINKCEKQLFTWLKKSEKAEFFWDYDSWYLENPVNDAGKFLRENLIIFPAPENFKPEIEAFNEAKTIEIVSVPSANGQSQVIPEFFKGMPNDTSDFYNKAENRNFDQTAVVLADESLLFPVLGALPENIDGINVTMGYPVRNSPVMGFLYLLSSLLRNTVIAQAKPVRLYFRLVSDILNHQLISGVEPDNVHETLTSIIAENKIYVEPSELFFSPIHQTIFSLPASVKQYPAYFLKVLEHLYKQSGNNTESTIIKELIYHIYLAVEKLQMALDEVMKSGDIPVTPAIFFRLMNQYLAQVSVPFEGEPLTGLQVMGILETRCLDFENLVIIGLNEDIWPRSYTSPSLIPYNLRKSFGLPGIDDQDAMYAYYFYRLLQRAKRITITWNTIREGLSGGELSRYGFQLKLLSPHKVISRSHDYPFVSQTVDPIEIMSGNSISEKLLKMNADGRILSPSAINTWLSCSLRFYFRYVLGIEEPDEVAEEIDRRAFGNIFHKAVENLYEPYVGKTIDRKTLDTIKKNKSNIDNCIQRAFATEFFKQSESNFREIQIEGKALLIFSTIRSYIFNLIDIDIKHAPITLHSLEGYFEAPVKISLNGISRAIRVGGKIDRLDSVASCLRVIDYKTGNLASGDLSCKQLTELYNPEIKKQKKEIVQALVYSLILRKKYYPEQPITATIYAILKLNDDTFNPNIRIGNSNIEIGEVEHQWESILTDILENIYSPEAIFSQTAFKERCGYCPYKLICGR